MRRSRTVDRELVHRVSVAEVLLTDVRPCGADRFEAAACWPRSHPTFPRGRDDRHSPLVLVETLRQLGIYVPLTHYGVAPGARFLITDLGFAVDPAAEPRAGFGASEITCRVAVDEVRRGGSGAVRGLRMRVRFLAGEVMFGRAWGGSRFLGEREYATLRKAGAAARGAASSAAPGGSAADGGTLPGARTGVLSGARGGGVRPAHAALDVGSPGDVVLGLEGGALVLDPADPWHPFLFDHGSDHVPGMALIEAARQAAAVRSGGALLRPVSGELRALRFTEHAPFARVECAVYAGTGVFRFRQGGSHTAVGVLRYRR
ncbi:ScbA/BarX family gamma-butyrolactone biosynthesis protein [Streptomyces sp. SL13]|uniref:ScbA/BarX family gamma-butyrolactone biosynthesis protein n=1 Tax=Streptantibioticus silvisoli TaxID=2705255 RepID=A0AA90K7K1_9ACTN|nr:ScbA/BarX family gamma-butyrolactone biosynthesis protein [Streptantibioticus silvisoli]MDI5968983.1 ScbA/BarX family gamma-butyrolactone biosynthesis protein [Streptantibioticus silvisoli]